jgi:hypothetical protein
MTYVAISRVTKYEHLHLINVSGIKDFIRPDNLSLIVKTDKEHFITTIYPTLKLKY